MELYTRIFILCLLCVACAFEVLPEEIGAESSTYVRDLSKIPVQKTDRIDGQSTENPRDKRALGLLLSGLAQIFGYTVTPIQFASLPNPNVTELAAMSNSSNVDVRQQAVSSQPMNTTVPRQQETIRFTGVLNFGNNSNILGHLQQYEQIFHGRQNNTMMTTLRPASMPTLPAKISVDLGTNSQTKPPLLAPFFVKIPLPIAPGLISIDPVENLELSHPSLLISMNNSTENTETPVRKEQETVYRNNEDTERYTVKEKDIYDEKDVKKPIIKYNHQLYIDEPRRNKQQNNRYNELQRKQQERIKNLEQEERNRKADHYKEQEINERYRNREEEIADRNRGAFKNESKERRPTHHDEEDESSAERYQENDSQENLSNKFSEQSSKKDEKEENEDYHDDSNKQFNETPEDFDKYVEIGYNQQLPIGDYFHEGNPEVIRDSYGEVLDNKKLEDDRIAGYISMFKHPYVQTNAYDSQRAHNLKDTSREENGETSSEDSYDEHLTRLQKLREEYALPENKYEEYDLNDENEAGRNNRENLRIQNNTLVRSKMPKTGRIRGKNDRARRPTGLNGDDVARLENARSQEVDFGKYMPLVVPVRYIDANDKVQQATTRQLNYKEADKLTDSRFSEDNVNPMQTVSKEQNLLTPQIGLPERSRQLHEGEHKELQVWPPPFDYVFDDTEPATTIVPPNLSNYYPIIQNYAPNYYQHVVKKIAAQDANNKPSEQSSGYLVVVGNPQHPYRYPYNIYYFSNEAVNSRDQDHSHPHAEDTRPRDPVYVAQQSVSQQIVQAKPNITEYNLNETANSPYNYYYQPQEVSTNVLDRYRYTFQEPIPQTKEPFNIDIRNQILNTENWSNKIYRPQSPSNRDEQSPRLVFTQLQNIAPLNQNRQSGLSEKPRQSRLLRKRQIRENLRPENHKNDEKTKMLSTLQPILKSKPFNDPQSAHDFFDFSKDDYNFGNESSDATKVVEENGKTMEESDALVAPEPTTYHHNDENMKQTDELENDMGKAKVREYRNKVATLRVSERRQLMPNGPIHYVDFIRNI